MKYLLYIFLFLNLPTLIEGKVNTKTIYFQDLRNTSSSAWDNFYAQTYTLPKLLDAHKTQKNNPLVLITQEITDIASPLDDRAVLLEGTRVAHTWASVYFRFYDNNIRILQLPQNYTISSLELENYIYYLGSLNIEDDPCLNPEEQIKQRIFNLESLKSPSKLDNKIISLDALRIHQEEKTNFLHITPKFQYDSSSRYLVTGGAGFIGNYFVKQLLDQGHQVIVLDDLSCCEIENIEDIIDHPNFMFVEHDVRHPFTIEGPIDAVIHMASIPSPEMYYNMPLKTMETGLNGTKNCLDLAKEKNARFLFTSTSEVYGDPEVHPQPEDYPGNVSTTGKRSQYDQSKRGGETLCKFYFDAYHMDIRIARIFNTYGPKMQLGDGRVVTNFIRAALENKPMLLHGGGQQTRSFAYLHDTVDCLLKILETPKITPDTPLQERVFNAGSQNEFTVIDLANKVNNLSKTYLTRTTPIKSVSQQDSTDPKQRCPELTRSNTILDFYPKISLHAGLEKTFCYFLKKYGYK